MKSVLDTRLYRYLEVFSSFLILSIVWAVACIPVITAFPATVALFSVVRKWSREREFDGALRNFVAYFRAGFVQSLGIGLLWVVLAAVIVLNFLLIGEMPIVARVPLYVFFSVVAFLYSAATAFLFPVVCHFDTGWKMLVANSLLLALSRFPATLAVLCVYFVAACLVFVVPVSTFLVASIVAYIVYRICERTFEQIEARIPEDRRSH